MIRIFALCVFWCIFGASAHVYGPYKVGNPYKIQGEQYVPAETEELVQTGVASWYGKELAGKHTANGAIFNPDLYTAAHRTLPMPSVVLVTNLTNKKSVAVVVNDRGPFSTDKTRIIDVSKKVAEELGFADVGRANVRIEYMPELSRKLKNHEDFDIEEYNKKEHVAESKTPTVTTVNTSIDVAERLTTASAIGKTAFTKDYVKAFYVQVGVFEILSNAQKIYHHLAGVSKIQLRSESHNIKNYYIVRSGPFGTIAEAEASKIEIEKQCNSCQTMIIII